MTRRASLLEIVQGLLERTYRMRAEVEDVARFVIGDAGYRRFYGVEEVGSASGQAKTLVRETGDGVRACIYYPDSLVHRLERFPPQSGLREENVDAFATLVEELDHLLLIADRARVDRSLTLFELELHANVSKYLVLSRFAAGAAGARVAPHTKNWLRHALFHSLNDAAEGLTAQERYRDAARWAVKLIDSFPRFDPVRRLSILRRFHDADAPGKVGLIGRIAA